MRKEKVVGGAAQEEPSLNLWEGVGVGNSESLQRFHFNQVKGSEYHFTKITHIFTKPTGKRN